MAVIHTATKRGSLEEINEFGEICVDMQKDEVLHRLWNNYIEENTYAGHLKFDEIIENVLEVGRFIGR
ncbi:MAG: hypothetical protein SOV90_00990 [Lachnospiraceae bacterium]|nr:hypothetical protein [Eubacteriales bacterium]MDY2606495.1 hypothetical protein [Lachnospiraceae bacterium]